MEERPLPHRSCRFRTLRRLATVGALILAAPAAGFAQDPARTPDGAPRDLDLSPRAGLQGTQVTVRIDGLPASMGVVIAFGGLRTGYEWVEQVETDEEGALDETVQVPSWADESETQYFFVKLPGQVPVAIAPFHVMAEDGVIRTAGRITDEGNEWLAMRGPDNELFCLRGELAGAEPGSRVRVVGRPAENWTCPAGIPVDVYRVDA